MENQRNKSKRFKHQFRAPVCMKPGKVIIPARGKGSYDRKKEKMSGMQGTWRQREGEK